MSDPKREMPRRRLLQLMVGSAAAACSAPQLPERVIPAASGELAVGSSKMFRYGHLMALLVHASPGRYYAIAADCTHGRCTVRFRPEQGDLFCPCHDGRFDLQGRILGGPPVVPLQSFPVTVEGGQVIVSRPGGSAN